LETHRFNVVEAAVSAAKTSFHRLASGKEILPGLGHSAEVKMHVVRDGSKLQVSQLGPDFLLLDEADDFEGPAQVILSVDGVTHSRDVQLQCGSTSTEKTISFL
jgi:hypothetical protein